MNSGTGADSRSHCSNSGAISPRQYLLPSDLRASITSSWFAEMIKRREVACAILDLGIGARGQGELGRYMALTS